MEELLQLLEEWLVLELSNEKINVSELEVEDDESSSHIHSNSEVELMIIDDESVREEKDELEPTVLLELLLKDESSN